MNAVEIEEAVAGLVAGPFDPDEFPYAFLAAFGNKPTAIKRLRKGSSNKTDVPGAVLYRNNVHLKACAGGEATATLAALAASPAAAKQKAKYALATDGRTVEAQRLGDGELLACRYDELHHEFTFFLPLAGITTVQQVPESEVDVKATVQLNKLYVELLRENPGWDAADRREQLNHFMARLIFCLFAEDTGIFLGDDLFTQTLTQMTARDGSDTHAVLAELFRAMNVKQEDREAAGIKSWAISFPYVNGGLFGDVETGGDPTTPRFSKAARSYLIHVGRLNWTKINPDIFGSMIQAVADDEERGALGMHYTSVPNIRKVLDPLFLTELRDKLEEAGDGSTAGSKRKLYNLRERLSRIRVFDPACGSGNFLVIAYKQMRAIEAEVNARRDERGRASAIPLTNFRGIELRHFSCEIARLALVIAEYQCDVLHRGEKLALAEFLPLDADNWITCGNALRLDWLKLCPPTGTATKAVSDDLFETPLDQPEIEFENTGGETYVCGNPPYKGRQGQTAEQKEDLRDVFQERLRSWKSLDYVAGWFMKAADYLEKRSGAAAFVSTNSICQGQQVPILWPKVGESGCRIKFAYSSFVWRNLASHNAGVVVIVVGISRRDGDARLYEPDESGDQHARTVGNINGYLIASPDVFVDRRTLPLSNIPAMEKGNQPTDGGALLMEASELRAAKLTAAQKATFIRPVAGSAEFIRGKPRYCLWISDADAAKANEVSAFRPRFSSVQKMRAGSTKASTVELAKHPHRFGEVRHDDSENKIIVPIVSSENREFFPAGCVGRGTIVTNLAYIVPSPPGWALSVIVSKLHLVWIATVCGKLKSDYRYSNTLGWNTFPVPPLTEQNKLDLTRCAEDILLAREAHWPATIADLYDPDAMPEDLRAAHDRNDETLERVYVGRRFKNDTERLETLFALYAEMTADKDGGADD